MRVNLRLDAYACKSLSIARLSACIVVGSILRCAYLDDIMGRATPERDTIEIHFSFGRYIVSSPCSYRIAAIRAVWSSNRDCATCLSSQWSPSNSIPSSSSSYRKREIFGKVSDTRKSATTFHRSLLTRRQICILFPSVIVVNYIISQETKSCKPEP